MADESCPSRTLWLRNLISSLNETAPSSCQKRSPLDTGSTARSSWRHSWSESNATRSRSLCLAELPELASSRIVIESLASAIFTPQFDHRECSLLNTVNIDRRIDSMIIELIDNSCLKAYLECDGRNAFRDSTATKQSSPVPPRSPQ